MSNPSSQEVFTLFPRSTARFPVNLILEIRKYIDRDIDLSSWWNPTDRNLTKELKFDRRLVAKLDLMSRWVFGEIPYWLLISSFVWFLLYCRSAGSKHIPPDLHGEGNPGCHGSWRRCSRPRGTLWLLCHLPSGNEKFSHSIGARLNFLDQPTRVMMRDQIFPDRPLELPEFWGDELLWRLLSKDD